MTGIYFILLKRPCLVNLEAFQHQFDLVKKSGKYISSKTNLAPFCILVALILDWNCVRVIKIVKGIKYEGAWS